MRGETLQSLVWSDVREAVSFVEPKPRNHGSGLYRFRAGVETREDTHAFTAEALLGESVRLQDGSIVPFEDVIRRCFAAMGGTKVSLQARDRH